MPEHMHVTSCKAGADEDNLEFKKKKIKMKFAVELVLPNT